MASQPLSYLSRDAYLAMERASETKHEYVGGEIVAMTGASREHNLIVANAIISLGQQLRGRPCELYPSDMRVRVPAADLYTYPDVVVVCGEPQFEDDEFDTLLNPTLLVEVLSDSTEGYDRGKKFAYYRTLPSFQEYLLVAQHEVLVEHYARQGDGSWRFAALDSLDEGLDLAAIGCSLPLHELYDRVFS